MDGGTEVLLIEMQALKYHLHHYHHQRFRELISHKSLSTVPIESLLGPHGTLWAVTVVLTLQTRK